MRNLTLKVAVLFFITLFLTSCSEDATDQIEITPQPLNVSKAYNKSMLYNECGNAIFWNKLGSPTEIVNSEIGQPMVIGGTPTFETGKFGNGITIDHYRQYVTVDLWEPEEKHWGQDEFTFEFWCRLNNYGYLGFLFDFARGYEVNNGFLRIYLDHTNSGKVYFNSAVEISSTNQILLPHGYDIGNWHHYAVVVSKSHGKIYYDGELLASRPLKAEVLNTNMPYQVTLGGEFQHIFTLFRFYGTLDNWKVYDYAKSDFSDILKEAPFIDTDCDGISDSEDDCPESNFEETIVIRDCDSGVSNYMFETGCTMSDLIAACEFDARNHGDFVSCVSHLTNTWKKEGLISGREKGAIQRCAAKSNIP